MVNPGGIGRPRRVISARLAPLPPSSSRWEASPSVNSQIHCAIVAPFARSGVIWSASYPPGAGLRCEIGQDLPGQHPATPILSGTEGWHPVSIARRDRSDPRARDLGAPRIVEEAPPRSDEEDEPRFHTIRVFPGYRYHFFTKQRRALWSGSPSSSFFPQADQAKSSCLGMVRIVSWLTPKSAASE